MYARMTKFVGLAPERIDATVAEFEKNALSNQAGPRRDPITERFEVILHRKL